jgi:molybdopterin-guanine dinucleotide biosynthesis protein A
MGAIVSTRISTVTGVILAGGSSSRMGSNKALLPCPGGLFIETVHRQLADIFSDVLLVTNTPDHYAFLRCRTVTDLIPGAGPLAGIHGALSHCTTPYIFVVACDMPWLQAAMIRHLVAAAAGYDVVIPHGDKGQEALHAVYGKGALPAVTQALQAGKRRIVSFFDQVRVRQILSADIARFDPEFRSFQNINTPEEYYRFREELRSVRESVPPLLTAPERPVREGLL